MSGLTVVADSSPETMMTVLARLHESFLDDEDLYEDLDAILGAPAGPMNLARRAGSRPTRSLWHRLRFDRRAGESVEPAPDRRHVEHMHRMLAQLAQIASYHVRVDSSGEMAEAIARADCLTRAIDAGTADTGTLSYLRRIALAAQELIEVLSTDEAPMLGAKTYQGWGHP